MRNMPCISVFRFMGNAFCMGLQNLVHWPSLDTCINQAPSRVAVTSQPLLQYFALLIQQVSHTSQHYR